MSVERYKEKIYAGVLGKIIGVYLGRPIEGWPYEKIYQTFGDVDYYKHLEIGVPLIVPDDDISGTFTFYRALEDNDYSSDISSIQIGDSWLNYIIENKTILWWGGLGRSTEHTAYLRLVNGIKPPESGSIAFNGRSIAEQIGAQIFIDAWALVNPNEVERAVTMARKAASVSHDGIAIDAACFWAAMESLAFSEKNIDRLIDAALQHIKNSKLSSMIRDVQDICGRHADWRMVRDWIAAVHGYDKYSGSCPIVTNHLAMMMALIYGQDDFQKSISIACSAGWDTDCNAGNVGCLNGIRLGLSGINAGADLRSAVADRLYVVTSDGGSCVSDAVIESRKIFNTAARLRNETVMQPKERFAFEFPGSVQGWTVYPDLSTNPARGSLTNDDGMRGLVLHYSNLAKGVSAAYSVETFPGGKSLGRDGTSYFEVLSSPTLYPTQKVTVLIQSDQEMNPLARFFVEYLATDGSIGKQFSPPYRVLLGRNSFDWVVPNIDIQAIFRFGIELASSKRLDGELRLISADWGEAPIAYRLGRSIELSADLTPWTTETVWLKTFLSSAEQFFPDFETTFSISHPKENGVVTTGTADWKDYAVESRITFSKNEGAGIIARAKGHRQYYAAMIKNGKAMITIRKNEFLNPIASVPFDCAPDSVHRIRFEVKGKCLRFIVDDAELLVCEDGNYVCGGAGFIVDSGAMLADGFLIEKL